MKRLIIGGGIVTITSVAWWLISPFFITKTVDDTLNIDIATIQETTPDESVTAPNIRGPFPIIDTPGHPASGEILVVTNEDQTIVRFADYAGTNGPDLFVYLAKDLEASEFVNLGRARGNQGNINYIVPNDVNVSDYRYVMTWCRAFGELFDYAVINETL